MSAFFASALPEAADTAHRFDVLFFTMLAVTGQVGVRFADTSLLDLAVAGTPIELVFEWSIAAGKLLRFTVHM